MIRTPYERGKAAGLRYAGHVGSRSDRGAFDLVCAQAVAYDLSRKSATRNDRAWYLGMFRGLRS